MIRKRDSIKTMQNQAKPFRLCDVSQSQRQDIGERSNFINRNFFKPIKSQILPHFSSVKVCFCMNI